MSRIDKRIEEFEAKQAKMAKKREEALERQRQEDDLLPRPVGPTLQRKGLFYATAALNRKIRICFPNHTIFFSPRDVVDVRLVEATMTVIVQERLEHARAVPVGTLDGARALFNFLSHHAEKDL